VHARDRDIMETARGHMEDLAAMLRARGLTVRVHDRAGVVMVRNEAAEPDDPRGRIINPGLSQVVALSLHEGALTWFWQWSGPTRDAPPEYELLGPADATAEAGERICRVLSLASV
jgi:hypothetical protein